MSPRARPGTARPVELSIELEERLLAYLRELDGLAVAFSGGVDSTVLLHAATRALGDRAMGVVADSPSLPRRELDEATAAAREMGARLVVVPTDELADERYVANRGDRCYFCKSALFDAMERIVAACGVRHLAFGEITDDRADHRPGARAAAERGILAPLSAVGFSKADVRAYARRHGLSAAEKPASACLASRIPVGRAVTPDDLARVERAEAALRELGFRILRVRNHGENARVEVGAEERDEAERSRAAIADRLRGEGFREFVLATYGDV